MKSLFRLIAVSMVLIVNVLSYSLVFSQETQKKITKQSALEAFSKEDYESALTQFNYLSNQYSLDPIYKYYSGVCLVFLKRDPRDAEELLDAAIKSSAVIKTVPDDAWFYLGRAQQMAGQYGEAIDSYNSYTDIAGKKTAKIKEVPDYIIQCSEKRGVLSVAGPVEPVIKDTLPPLIAEKNPVIITKDPPVVVENKVTGYLPDVYNVKMNDALDSQFSADSLMQISDSLHSEMSTLPWDKRIAIQRRISELDSLASLYQQYADGQYYGTSVINTLGETDSPGNFKQDALAVENITPSPPLKAATDLQISQPLIEAPPVVLQQSSEGIILSLFQSPDQNKPADKEVHLNEQFPGGLVYVIQVAVFRNPLNADYFKGLGPVYGLKEQGSDRTFYYIGLFRRMLDAGQALTKVAKAGFGDAFIVAFSDNKQISTDRAKILEAEWGNKSLFPVTVEKVTESAPAKKDTVSASLLFRVEVLTSAKPIKPETLEVLKKLAGDKGLEVLFNDNKLYIYLIGKFLNFESASEYSDLLIRNGYDKARVVAYIGKIEIPVEVALKLFEK